MFTIWGFCFGLLILFLDLKGRETESSHLVVHPINASNNSLGKLEARSSIQVSLLSGRKSTPEANTVNSQVPSQQEAGVRNKSQEFNAGPLTPVTGFFFKDLFTFLAKSDI